MKKQFFLTAMFENKYGTAKKYYDGKGWHWMLNFDRPKMYETELEAVAEMDKLNQTELEGVRINRVSVHKGLWEHKIKWEEVTEYVKKFGEPVDVVEYIEQKKHYLFLSPTEQMNCNQLIKGLYCLDRKNDIWIYCE